MEKIGQITYNVIGKFSMFVWECDVILHNKINGTHTSYAENSMKLSKFPASSGILLL